MLIQFPFRCPKCFAQFRPANAKTICCPNCFYDGGIDHFSAKVRQEQVAA
jgi:hypothetical protein